MTQSFTEPYKLSTSKNFIWNIHAVLMVPNLSLHIQPFYHQFSLVIDKNNEVQFFEHTLCQRNFSKYREAGKLAILQALEQVMPYRSVIKLYTAWIFPTTNV